MSEKVTLLINSLGGGGAEGVCVTLANGLAKRGWDVTLIVLHLDGAVHQQTLNPAVKLQLLGKKNARTATLALWRFLRADQPRRILVFNHQLAVLLVVIKALSRFPLIIVARNISNLSQKRRYEKSFWHKYIAGFFVWFFYRRVDCVVAQSHGMVRDLVENYGFPSKKIKVINNPICYNIHQYLDMSIAGTAEKEGYFLCVGRLEKEKGFHNAIDAFARISGDYPEMRLKIVGKGGLEGRLKEQAQTLGVAARVDFEGFQEDVIPYYRHARATLLTSLYEGFPNVLLESIALGTPVVAFDCPSGPSEIIRDGENGYLVKYLDVCHLSEGLRQTIGRDWDVTLVSATATQYKTDFIIEKYIRVLS